MNPCCGRRIKSSVAPAVALPVAFCTAFVLWRGAGLVTAGAMTAGGLIVFLTYLGRRFKPVQDLGKMTNSVAQTSVATERIRAILETDDVIRERPNARVREIVECFEADWSRRQFEPPTSSNLIWSPGHSRSHIAEFIDGAKHSLYIQSKRYQDAIIVERWCGRIYAESRFT